MVAVTVLQHQLLRRGDSSRLCLLTVSVCSYIRSVRAEGQKLRLRVSKRVTFLSPSISPAGYHPQTTFSACYLSYMVSYYYYTLREQKPGEIFPRARCT